MLQSAGLLIWFKHVPLFVRYLIHLSDYLCSFCVLVPPICVPIPFVSSFMSLHWTDSIFSKRWIYPLFIHFQKCRYIRIYTEGKWYYVHPPCWYSNYVQVTDGVCVYKRSIREIMDSMVTVFSRALYWAYHSIRVLSFTFSQIIQISKFCVGATLCSLHTPGC